MTVKHDLFQGKIGTVSPAFGNYYIDTYIDIDRGAIGVTGQNGVTGYNVGASGVTGMGTLTSWKTDIGLTGIFGNVNTNIAKGW